MSYFLKSCQISSTCGRGEVSLRERSYEGSLFDRYLAFVGLCHPVYSFRICHAPSSYLSASSARWLSFRTQCFQIFSKFDPTLHITLDAITDQGSSIKDIGIFQGRGGSQIQVLQDIRRQKFGKSGHGREGYKKRPKKFRRLLWTAP